MTDDEPLFDETVEHNMLPRWANELTAAVRHLTKEIKRMSDDQAHLDADIQTLQQATVKEEENVKALQDEIAALKAQPAAAALDFAALDQIAAQLQGDANPAAPPAA